MKMTLSKDDMFNYIFDQIELFFPDKKIKRSEYFSSFLIALDRLEVCFQHVTISGYHKDGEVYFSHLHSDQYIQFLYFLSNTIWKNGLNQEICSKIMNLIRLLSGMFVSYKCKLPEIFIFYHSVGSVIGNADYSNYLVIFQNVTVNTGNDEYGNLAPKIGTGCFLAAGAKVIGNKKIGDRVSIGVNSIVYNQEIPSDSIVVVDNGISVVKKRKKEYCKAQDYFDIKF